MVVGPDGRAWVGDFGYDLLAGAPPAPGSLVVVDPDGAARPAADGLGFPNGMVLTSGGELVVAESSANRLTAFTIGADGGLTERRVWADLGATTPDGICLDVEGAIWVADPLAGEVVRVRDGGEVAGRVRTVASGAFACVLGGDDGRTLYIATATEEASLDPSAPPVGAIEVVTVDVPTAGSP
jgi:sugar lactone lactonase YvrE